MLYNCDDKNTKKNTPITWLIGLIMVGTLSGGTLSGCSYHPADRAESLKLPSALVQEIEQSTSVVGATLVSEPQQLWWRQFSMKELDSLLLELNKNNRSLEVARLNIEKSKALLAQQSSRSWPTLDFGTSHNSNRDHNANEVTDAQSSGFTAKYEVDLWGSRKAADNAAKLKLDGEKQRLHQLSLQLQSQLSQQYFSHLALKERYRIALQNLQASQELLDLISLRFDLGNASGIELDQQRNVLFSQQAQIVELKRDLGIGERAIALLLGRENSLKVDSNGTITEAIIPDLQAIQPAKLLQTRPDIQIAELQLKISDTEVYIANKKKWPSLSLSADLQYVNPVSGGAGFVSSLIGAVSGPIFDAGNIDAQLTVAEIDSDIALINYRDTVLSALRETVDTLSTVAHQKSLFAISTSELENNKRLYQAALDRYDAGNVDFIYLLDAQRSWFGAQEKQVNAKLRYLTAVVDTFRAIGQSPKISGV